MHDLSCRSLVELVSYHFDIDVDRLRPDTTFEELEMDSLALMELVVVIESETGIRIPDDLAEIGPDATISEIADAVKRIGEGAVLPDGQGLRADRAVPRDGATVQAGGARVE
ncbi:acyl carrier protein [Streptomyces altiplanensis]